VCFNAVCLLVQSSYLILRTFGEDKQVATELRATEVGLVGVVTL